MQGNELPRSLPKGRKVFVIRMNNQALLTVVEGRFIEFAGDTPMVRIPSDYGGTTDYIVVDCGTKDVFLKRRDALFAAADRSFAASQKWMNQAFALYHLAAQDAARGK